MDGIRALGATTSPQTSDVSQPARIETMAMMWHGGNSLVLLARIALTRRAGLARLPLFARTAGQRVLGVRTADPIRVGTDSGEGRRILVADTMTPAERAKRMSLIRCKDTEPEYVVRRLVHSMGYRYRLHGSRLPGKPDMVFAGRRKVIFVHGCFWHRHPDADCDLARLPKSRLDFWLPKLEGNKQRDAVQMAALRQLGWNALVVWECQLRDRAGLEARIRQFLQGDSDEIS